MKTSQNLYVDGTDKVRGYILEVGVTRRRVAYLEVGESPYTVTFMLDDPAFLDKLSNEADRLCREFVGDVPGGQATLTSAVTREPVNFTFPEPTTVVVP